MGVRIDIKRSDFYNGLSFEKQQEYFFVKGLKFKSAVDNIYYSVFLQNDHNYNHNTGQDPNRAGGLQSNPNYLSNNFSRARARTCARARAYL